MSNLIKPTIGRIVWYTPGKNEVLPRITGMALAAIIVGVWSDTCVNLTVFDANGNTHGKTSVPLMQDDNFVKGDGFYCEWMPYQKGQAEKTEQLEQQLCANEFPAPAFGENSLPFDPHNTVNS